MWRTLQRAAPAFVPACSSKRSGQPQPTNPSTTPQSPPPTKSEAQAKPEAGPVRVAKVQPKTASFGLFERNVVQVRPKTNQAPQPDPARLPHQRQLMDLATKLGFQIVRPLRPLVQCRL